ncbi:organic hydroperoxide resistance protein [Gemmobacter fulvus]|uniref:Organic hydroperoxide resistance protein n=1 Tax=Gemmobacter fulvus TaxID=2840474 RepID=A0A975S0W8_9RHOB|nr:organic hydroperoxide resistance protein [Gemmobacter fulvus]MBT9245830.1 organic hydroperoxide resistance protein [Gemmobacter fulvus]QWK89333.1 organic hydroperoxide resistance protein [Gemmobacter fulvus]
MIKDVVYRTVAEAKGGGRNGTSATLDGALAVTLSVPKEMGGEGKGNNPEQLFAVGYAACYLGAIRFAAGNEKIGDVPVDASVKTQIGIGPRAEGGFGITATLTVSLPGVERSVAERMVERGHFICPYSNAIKGNVHVVTILE